MLALTLAVLIPNGFAQNRIVNGTVVEDFGTYPEVVMVHTGSGNCTGSLIHSEWVLTAAHCFDDVRIADDPTGGGTQIRFGYAANSGSTEEIVAATQVIVHAGYLSIGPSLNGNPNPSMSAGTTNDIALVRLAQPVTRQVMALNTEPLNPDWIGRPLTFIGFGVTFSGGNDSGLKRYVEVPIESYTDDKVFDLATGTPAGTCQGDSGGPGVYYQATGYIQTSITAYGRECGVDRGAHMRVDFYIPWIEQQLPAGTQLLKQAAAPSSFVCSHQLDPDSPQSIALGVVPMDLRCEVISLEPETITEVEWRWGDGSTPETLTATRASHVYDEMGVYNLSACIRGDRGGIPYENCVTRVNHVNACGVPEVSFEIEQGDGLVIDLFNTTPLRAYTCITNAKWEVYEGEGVSGSPILEYSNWDPTIEVEKPGTYTVVLNVGGLGGTGAALATLKVGSGVGCSTAPGMAPAFLLPFALLGLRRRR